MDTSRLRYLAIGAFPEFAKNGDIFGWFADDQNFGIPKRIAEVLIDGGSLNEETSAETHRVVTEAFRRFDRDPPSRNLGECCRGLIALARRKTLKP